MKTLVNSAFSKSVLLNGTMNNQIVQFFLVVMHAGNPLFRRNNFNHADCMFVFGVEIFDKVSEIVELFELGPDDWAKGN